MKKMTILFPGSYFNYRHIEEDMREEYNAVRETGLFDTCLFNYDAWLAGEQYRTTNTESIARDTIYRGWMLKPEEYGNMYEALLKQDLRLHTPPAAYEKMHLFPNIYPSLIEDTAGMMVFKNREVDVEQIKKKFHRFMVKDSVKSVKGTEFPVFFDNTVTQAEFDKWMEVFYKYRGDLITGGICIKEYLDLKRYEGITNEFRVFYANGQVISVSRNANQPIYTDVPPADLVMKYRNLNSPYYTIDYAELSDGTWRIIEAGDGGVSGLSPGQDPVIYYRSLYYAFMT